MAGSDRAPSRHSARSLSYSVAQTFGDAVLWSALQPSARDLREPVPTPPRAAGRTRAAITPNSDELIGIGAPQSGAWSLDWSLAGSTTLVAQVGDSLHQICELWCRMSWDRARLGRLASATLSWLTVWVAAVSGCASGPERTLRYPDGGALEVHIAERALIIALRPGDETVTAAGLAQRVIKRVGTVSTLLLSAGEGAASALAAGPAAPERPAGANQARQRSNEARSAARVCGRGLIRLALLGVPDVQLAALGCEPELRSALSGAHCSGALNKQPAAPSAHPELRLSAAARNVKSTIERALRAMPTLVAFPDPSEGQPEQRAVGILTMLALQEHMRGRTTPWPRALAYVTRPGAWPRALSRAARDPDMPPTDPPRRCLPLNEHERTRKREALAAYETQRELLSVANTDSECFSDHAPEHLEQTLRELLFLPPVAAHAR